MVFGLFESPRPFKGQEYSKLKKQSQESCHPFIDNEFPPDDKSLFYSKGKLAGVIWKRPKDICENPQLFVEGVDRGDVHQGRLGNCWFVAACSCLTLYKEIWHRVIPNHKEQEWNEEKPENYCGLFHFQFWRYGEWIDVVIDDFLPTLNGELVFVHSQSKNEFWSALLEKAYAKLFGCYEALDGGDLAEALVDFTGGVAEPLDLVDGKFSEDEPKRGELMDMLEKEMGHKSLMAASIPAKSADEMEAHTDMGLVKGHAYGITAVKKVPLAGTGLFNLFNREKIKMIRLRNPWGEGEWKGAFSDGSKEWEKISTKDREKIGLTFDDDGEFWMTFEDFCIHFHDVSICRVVNTSFLSIRKTWREVVHHGQWKKPQLAGGCLNNRETFLNNPQYVFEVPGEEDEVLISVMQKASRGQGPEADKLVMGFTVLKVELNRSYRVHRLSDVVKSSAYKNSRSIFLRHTFEKGRYVIFPCTFDAGHEGKFLLRVYTSSHSNSKELIEDKPSKNACFCFKYPQLVTKITVTKANGLEKQDTRGGADPYCIIECEGHNATTKVCKDTLNPFWKQAAIFYRKTPLKSPITVTIWNKNPVMDEFMGRQIFTSVEDKEGVVQEVSLMGKNKDKNPVKPGRLFVEISTKTDLVSL
ncbi:calpain-5-like isoform X2 [Lineus longissimus]|uniref:calpain-5-like isoform X2 n=1 Tax=Lineus longissimus TaxID=88925 RepID=UPI002B4EAC0F